MNPLSRGTHPQTAIINIKTLRKARVSIRSVAALILRPETRSQVLRPGSQYMSQSAQSRHSSSDMPRHRVSALSSPALSQSAQSRHSSSDTSAEVW